MMVKINRRLRRAVQLGCSREATASGTVQSVHGGADTKVNLLIFITAHRVHATVGHGAAALRADNVERGYFPLLRYHLSQ